MDTRVNKSATATVLACLCASALGLWGCEKKTPPMAEGRHDFQGRLKAAKLITTSGEKNAALETLATMAARAGEGQVVTQAISAINQSGVRNRAAEGAAPLLAQAGKVDDALAVVKLISDTNVRNRVLAAIATQE